MSPTLLHLTFAMATPFFAPVALGRFWLLLLAPLSVAIAVVYKTIKTDDLNHLPREAAYLALQILAFMLLAGVALFLITEVV